MPYALPKTLGRCPCCSLPFQSPNKIICPSCKNIIPLERINLAITKYFVAYFEALRTSRELRFRFVIWILALLPFSLIPPLVVVMLALFHRGTIIDNKKQIFDLTWPATIAIINIIISATLLIELRDQLVVWVKMLLNFWPLFDQRSPAPTWI